MPNTLLPSSLTAYHCGVSVSSLTSGNADYKIACLVAVEVRIYELTIKKFLTSSTLSGLASTRTRSPTFTSAFWTL